MRRRQVETLRIGASTIATRLCLSALGRNPPCPPRTKPLPALPSFSRPARGRG
jgi:hypothetical protein